MAKKLIPERITRTEEKSLSKTDIELLKGRRNKQFFLLFSGYLPFVAFGDYILLMGADSLNTGRNNSIWPNNKIKIDDDERSRFWIVAPYFITSLFVILNIYFIKLYFQFLRPLIKDIKLNKKQVLFFKPEKNPMAIFNKYFITTPVFNQQQIQVSLEDFDSIGDNNEICLEVAPNSTFILRFLNGEKEVSILNNFL